MKVGLTTTYLKTLGNTCLAAGLLCAASARAGTAVFDFQDDPTASGILKVYNNAQWWWPGTDPENSTNGFLSITEAATGQNGIIVFEDIDNGQVIRAFTFEMDLRIGNGTETPADGFSINYARSSDPLLAPLADGGNPGPFDQNQNCEAGLPEEGTQTGIAIGFDAYTSGGGTPGALCDVADQNIGLDARGLTVRVDGILVAQFPLPVLNGTCTDATSLQTGPRSETAPNSASGLCWAPLKVQLTEDGRLSVWWKNTQLLNNYQTTFVPGPGRLVFGGRTGDLHQVQHVDNIRITTVPAAVALVGDVTGHPLGFSTIINDSGASVVDTTKPVVLTLNGATVQSTSVEKAGAVTTVTYRGTTPLGVGATNTVTIAAKDTSGNDITATRTFVTPAYLNLPSSYRVASVDTSAPGFTVQSYRTTNANPNRIYWTDEQLIGKHGPNIATAGPVGGKYRFNGVLDFSNAGTLPNGQFPTDNKWDVLGLPLADPNVEGDEDSNISIAAMAYAHFPQAGLYTFGGNSDDGIRLTFAPNAQDLLGKEVPGMTADLGRGIAANQNQGWVYVPEAGYYGFRLVWENGGGGADLEFYTKGTPAGPATNLVNSADAGAIKVYATSPVAPAYVSDAYPVLMKPDVAPADQLVWRITDAGTTVQPSDVTAVRVDGATVTPTATKSGNVTTVTVDAPLTGWAAGTRRVELVVGPMTYDYTFTVVGTIVVLDPALAAPLGSQDASKPGFAARVVQADRTGSNEFPNRIYVAEQLLAGYWGTNTATVSTASIPGVINFNVATDAQGYFNANNGFADELFPGIPGNNSQANATYANEAFALEFNTWLEFKQAGVYQLNFNSDDGFQASLGLEDPQNIGQLEITSPAGLAGGVATAWGNDAGINIVSNAAPITGKIVLMKDNSTTTNPAEGCGTVQNPAALAGNIALVQRGTCQFSQKAKNAYDAGAKAIVIGANRPDAAAGEGWFPTEPGVGDLGRQPIPVVQIDQETYKRLTNALNSGDVTGTLHPWVRPGQPLFEADTGKGSSDVTQYVRVTEPGLYPVRISYWQMGGGGNAEFESHLADGTRALVNDVNNPNAIRAFQAVTVAPRPTLSVARTGEHQMRITYSGTLQSSDTVNGTYTDVAGATSPYTVDTSAGTAKFFRARE